MTPPVVAGVSQLFFCSCRGAGWGTGERRSFQSHLVPVEGMHAFTHPGLTCRPAPLPAPLLRRWTPAASSSRRGTAFLASLGMGAGRRRCSLAPAAGHGPLARCSTAGLPLHSPPAALPPPPPRAGAAAGGRCLRRGGAHAEGCAPCGSPCRAPRSPTSPRARRHPHLLTPPCNAPAHHPPAHRRGPVDRALCGRQQSRPGGAGRARHGVLEAVRSAAQGGAAFGA